MTTEHDGARAGARTGDISRRGMLAVAGAAATAAAFAGPVFAADNAVPAVRTPEDRFAILPDFPFAPNYLEGLAGYEGLRSHYVDVGPRDAKHTFLCLHGEPTWSYLYRKMIPVMLHTGGRVVAPDLLGFGRSDKPMRLSDYTFDFHREYLLRVVERLDLRNVTLVVQDWGGMLGLTLPADPGFRPRVARLIVMNTTIPVGTPLDPAFDGWRTRTRTTDLAVGPYMRSMVPQMTAAEGAAYDAPFPDATYKSGVRTFPSLVMDRPSMPGVATAHAAARFWSNEWSGPSFMAIGEMDPVLGLKTMMPLSRTIRGCPPPMHLKDVGHFVQESGEPVAVAALRSFGDIA